MRIEQGRFKGRALEVAGGVRPGGARLRGSLMDALAPWLEGARVLDLCAGAGGLGLEALSRGAARVDLVEQDPAACAALRTFLARVGAGAAEAGVHAADALTGRLPSGPFDLVFVDPPFPWWAEGRAAQLLERAAALLAGDGLVAVKGPVQCALPPDGALVESRRKRVGDAVWLTATHAESTPDVK